MNLHPVVADVTARIRTRSAATRAAYLERLDRARGTFPRRGALGCTNLAHAFAAAPAGDKLVLREARRPNLAIVTSYNDMLSAHQPYERFPAILKQAARAAGATAQVAGGVPAMCDGITQGEPGMELSLFSRDVIALATAVALAHLGLLLVGDVAGGHGPARHQDDGHLAERGGADEQARHDLVADA